MELLALNGEGGSKIRTTVLNLSGLWGGERHPRHWVGRVADTKERLADKVCYPTLFQLFISLVSLLTLPSDFDFDLIRF